MAKPSADFPSSIGNAIAVWQQAPPSVPPERIAVETGRSLSTVFRWWQPNGARLEPRASDVLIMERLKPGLLAKLSKLVKKAKRQEA